MTLPQLSSDLIRLVKHGSTGSEAGYYFDLSALADQLTEHAIRVALSAGLSPATHQGIITESIGELTSELKVWTDRLFAGEAGPDRAAVRFNRIIVLGQSIGAACADALEEIGEKR